MKNTPPVPRATIGRIGTATNNSRSLQQPGNDTAALPWVRVSSGVPYFETEAGVAWTPIGHNEAITWPRLASGDDVLAAYFQRLRECGVTCLRLMLEYAQRNGHFFERPVGRFNPRIIRIWDRLFHIGEEYGIRFLITPFDTFWMWRRWQHHPFNSANGGACDSPRNLLTSTKARAAMKGRLAFVIDRWGGSGALFAWDLWNEIHPAYAEDDPGHFDAFIADMAGFVRNRERSTWERTHPITVSAFGPMLSDGFQSRELGQTSPDDRASAAIFNHPELDFATVHTYASGTIDAPRNTVDAALVMGALTRGYIGQIGDSRPYFDSEHGPIHTFKDKRRVLPEAFDDEYFRHLQWAHLASGGAGGGMRWPNRSPHQLTGGMHDAQRSLAGFQSHIDWQRLRRRNMSSLVKGVPADYAVFCCGDDEQLIVWLLRRTGLTADGRLNDLTPAQCINLMLPGIAKGSFQLVAWDTEAGVVSQQSVASAEADGLRLCVHARKDLALAVRRLA